MGVSKNSGTPKSSILIGFSITKHPFWGTPIFWKHPYFHGYTENRSTTLFILAEAGNGGNRATCELWWSPQYRLLWGGPLYQGNQMRYTTLHQCNQSFFRPMNQSEAGLLHGFCYDESIWKPTLAAQALVQKIKDYLAEVNKTLGVDRAKKQSFAADLAKHPWFPHSGYEADAFWLGDVPRWPWLETHHRIGTGLGRQISCGFEGRHIQSGGVSAQSQSAFCFKSFQSLAMLTRSHAELITCLSKDQTKSFKCITTS